MSPDDIFAAQFWPWPDPAIKRDAQGRVLFVNAAFLALYGGQVENWRGNAVGGWPAPLAGGAAPYRFETRITGLNGSDQVYDWMEHTLTDGSAFALARNVTIFAAPPEPDPATTMAPAEATYGESAQIPPAQTVSEHDIVVAQQVPAHEALPVEAEPEIAVHEAPLDTYAQPPAQTPAHSETPVFAEMPPQQAAAPQAPIEQAPFEQAPIEQMAIAEAPAYQVTAAALPEIEIPQIDIPSDANYALTDTPASAAPQAPVELAPTSAAPQAPIEPAPASAELYDMTPAAAAQAPEAPREFERRALPIEDDSAVLGNNWRDAVIAKAVGVEGVFAVDEPEDEIVLMTEETEKSEQGGQIRILLAEDNAINALLTRTLLEAEGHSVDTVEDGVLAVEAMKTSSYDLIFMDMRMPNMDGLEATRKIRALSNVGRTLPIVALTANAFDDDRNACFDSGMNDFMTKPVSAAELSEKVRDWTSPEAKARLAKAA